MSRSRNIEFVAKVAKTPAKVSLIGPDRISQRFDYENSKGVYKGLDDFVDDVVRIEREIVESLVKAGCRYIHIDAPGFTAYVDQPTMEQMKARGEDPMANFSRSLKAESKVVENLGDGRQRHPSLPRQPAQHVAPRGHLRRHRRAAVQRTRPRPLHARIRHPARRQLRAAAVRAQGQGGGARPRQHQDLGDGDRRRPQAPDRRGGEVHPARPARDQPAMRLRLRRGRQPDQRRRSEAQARAGGRDRAAGVGSRANRPRPPARQRRLGCALERCGLGRGRAAGRRSRFRAR